MVPLRQRTRLALRLSIAGVTFVAGALVITGSGSFQSRTQAVAQATAPTGHSYGEHVIPDPPGILLQPAPSVPAAVLDRMHRTARELRERTASDAGVPIGPAGPEQLRGPEAVFVDDGLVDATPGALVVGRNHRNTRATVSPSASTLAEPAAANNAALVFAAGNFAHAEFSTDGGATWTNFPVPAGPTIAPIPFADNDVFIDAARRVTFWSLLYVDESLGTAIVRLYVIRNIGGPITCSFTFGAPGLFEDYPHIGANNTYLFLMTNVLGGKPSQRARVRRIPLDSLVNCVAQASIPMDVFDFANTILPPLP